MPVGQPYFTQGTLVSLTLRVPATVAPNQTVLIGILGPPADPDVLVIADGFDVIPATAGAMLALHVVPVPEPSAVAPVIVMTLLIVRAKARQRVARVGAMSGSGAGMRSVTERSAQP